MRNTFKVFVYGTLKVGGHYAFAVDDFRKSVKKAMTKGKMYSINGMFPGLVADDSTEVQGELHTYEVAALKILDNIEGYRAHRAPEENLYQRVEAKVTTEEGKKEKAFVYLFNHNVANYDEVKSGVWPI